MKIINEFLSNGGRNIFDILIIIGNGRFCFGFRLFLYNFYLLE